MRSASGTGTLASAAGESATPHLPAVTVRSSTRLLLGGLRCAAAQKLRRGDELADLLAHGAGSFRREAVVEARVDARRSNFLAVTVQPLPLAGYSTSSRAGQCELTDIANGSLKHLGDCGRDDAVCARVFRVRRRHAQRQP